MLVRILYVILVILFSDNVASEIGYAVPEPKIDIFDTRGFRVSIPDGFGLELFAFHGKINEPMNGLEAGQFSKDILTKCGGLWVFEDNTAKLNVGNTLYYWLFVIRNRLGHRFDNGKFVVREVTNYSPLSCEPTATQSPKDSWIFNDTYLKNLEHNPLFDVRSLEGFTGSVGLKKTEKRDVEISVCCDLFLNLSHRLVDVGTVNQKLIEENRILTELVERDEYSAKNLRLFGNYPETYYPTPKDFAQNLLREKLQLLNVRVVTAKTIPGDGISFTVETLRDKVNVILAAKSGLMGSNFELLW